MLLPQENFIPIPYGRAQNKGSNISLEDQSLCSILMTSSLKYGVKMTSKTIFLTFTESL